MGFYVVLICAGAYWVKSRQPQQALPVLPAPHTVGKLEVTRERIASALEAPLDKNRFPETIDFVQPDKTLVKARAQYTIDSDMQEGIEKMLRSYQPDYAAFVAMDATTGRVLALASYTRNLSNLGNLTLKAAFPAASVFKIVTATAALDQNKLKPDSVIPFTGSNHTLYRRNVMSQPSNRWARQMTLREAFAKSVNTVFAKIGMYWLKPFQLEEYAHRYRFNQPILTDLPVQAGRIIVPRDDNWAMAEIASGYNRVALMSPLQGAMMAAAVANDGVMMQPYFVDQLNSENGVELYKSQPTQVGVTMSAGTAEELRNLMRETVKSGTSRKAFRDLVRRNKRFAEVDIGGKTGSLHGIYPDGKCDWFVGYGMADGRKIAVAALTVNEENWRVKSSYLARSMIERYFKTHLVSMK